MPYPLRVALLRMLRLCPILLIVPVLPARAGDKASASQDKRVAVAKAAEAPGVLLERQAGKPWKLVGGSDNVQSGDILLVLPGGRGTIVSDSKRVTLELRGNLPQVSDYPVLESAVVLHANPDVDMDLTLDRGRVLISNSSKDKAKVRVRVRGGVWDLTLIEPGTQVAFQLASRLMPGAEFVKPPYEKTKPTQPKTDVEGFVVKGSVDLEQGDSMSLLQAPPGYSAFEWSSVNASKPIRAERKPRPAWVEEKAPYDSSSYIRAALDRVAAQMKDKTVAAALENLLEDAPKESDQRRAALLRTMAIDGFGAVGDSSRLIDLLEQGKTTQVRESAIEALHHWMGGAPGNDYKIYEYLVSSKKYEPKQADAVVALLKDFTSAQLNEPGTYRYLIGLLKGKGHVGTRELAHWHLQRLVPGSGRIKYDATASPEELVRAYKEYLILVPENKLPGDSK